MSTTPTTRVWTRATAAASFAVLALVIVFQLRIGGVVATLWSSHGVHSGDLLGVASALLALWLALPLQGLLPRAQVRAST